MPRIPDNPKIYHILHVDRLKSVVDSSGLLCDTIVGEQSIGGTVIGMSHIKERRKNNRLPSYPSITVGQCVPFYFCPRSVMLYIDYRGDHPDIEYRGGQEPIIHLEADLKRTVEWAEYNNKKWIFTLSNAGSSYFDDRTSLLDLGDLNWDAIQESKWQSCREEKQAEFLLETEFPFELVDRIGTYSNDIEMQVIAALATSTHKPIVEVLRDWYY